MSSRGKDRRASRSGASGVVSSFRSVRLPDWVDPLPRRGSPVPPARPGLIFVDWGSTRCRASLLTAGGTILEQRDGGAGILSRSDGDLVIQLRNMIGPWRVCHGALPTIVSGMAGSRNGLVEVPYLDCPADLVDLASAL